MPTRRLQLAKKLCNRVIKMNQESILVSKRAGIGIITVNRPQLHNALDRNTWLLLHETFLELKSDSEIGVIIITGAGGKSFVAGADLNSLKGRTAGETLKGENQLILRDIANCDKPTIAAINGFALGGGLELALACDIRICSANAKLGQTELNVGILPGGGGTQRLARLVGIGKAKELIFTGKIINADEAARIGMVNLVVEQERLLDTCFERAEEMCKKSPLILRLAKIAIDSGVNLDLGSALLIERLAQTVAFGSEDHLEGINAFLEKRTPHYEGR